MTEPLTSSASTMRFVVCPHAVDLRFLRCLLCQDANAAAAERARIRVAVEGLRSWGTIHTCWDDHEGEGGAHADGMPCPDDPREVVDRAAVLAAIDGGEG